jgi:hypothetical protein
MQVMRSEIIKINGIFDRQELIHKSSATLLKDRGGVFKSSNL